MSVLGEVFASLGAMSQMQLLLAFCACSGYVIAQGDLLPSRGRHAAWLVSVACAVAFAYLCTDWTHGAMLIAFAVAGLGLFVSAVWLTSRWLGCSGALHVEAEAIDDVAHGAPTPGTTDVPQPVAATPVRRPHRVIPSH